jgi:hypothetical protein
MKRIYKLTLTFIVVLFFNLPGSFAQIKIGDIPIDLDALLGKAKVLTVKKGFSPVFKLGDFQLNKVGLLGEKLKGVELLGQVFNKKNIDQVTKLYKTYKTGLVVFKVLAAAGTVAAGYSAVRGITADSKFNSTTVKALLIPGLTSLATGVITKIITKKASYKAVDIFNGIVKKSIKDIFSIGPASSNYGVGVYVKL